MLDENTEKLQLAEVRLAKLERTLSIDCITLEGKVAVCRHTITNQEREIVGLQREVTILWEQARIYHHTIATH
ncbi:hypothetical protein Patl1_24140 [Pistacia atlantica]|uniref:Uncharacterized protein n=1 Tax=Pistacia atlantica TaxID=434234 RepID=A0ACC1A114_9ROSI|nr:hypothetical protein Patl1_24140 [Pistacia atlantica]